MLRSTLGEKSEQIIFGTIEAVLEEQFVPCYVHFNVSISDGVPASLDSWWDFGNGDARRFGLDTTIFTLYREAGTYNVSCGILNHDGNYDYLRMTVVVKAAPFAVNIIPKISGQKESLEVSFGLEVTEGQFDPSFPIQWTVNDGRTGVTKSPNEGFALAFPTAGNYAVQAIVKGIGFDPIVVVEEFTLTPIPLGANFTLETLGLRAAGSLNITSGARDTNIPVTVNWGDGSVQDVPSLSTQIFIDHTYADPGTYHISALVHSRGGEQYSFSTNVTVSNQQPVIVQSSIPATVETPVTQTPQEAQHDDVVLKPPVDDLTPVIKPRNIMAHIISDLASGVAPLTVNFGIASDNDSLYPGTSARWDFGDGTKKVVPYIESSLNVAHTYEAPGTYQVSAVAVGQDGSTVGLSGSGLGLQIVVTAEDGSGSGLNVAGMNVWVIGGLAAAALAAFVPMRRRTGKNPRRRGRWS